MASQILLLACVLLSLACMACGRYTGASAPGGQASLEIKDVIEKVTLVESTLKQETQPSWRVNITRMNPEESLRSVYFLDDTRGWVGGANALYETSNGGKTWERVKIDLPKGSAVIKVFFANPTLGWAVAQKEAAHPWEYTDNHFWLMQTSDGGQSWKIQLEDENSEVRQIRFADEREGWLVGRKYLGVEPLRARDFIFHTLDRGQHWQDVSEELNQRLTDYDGYMRRAFTDITPEGPLAAKVLMPEGRIFRTKNGGVNWQQESGVIDSFNYICSCLFGTAPNGQLWVAGGKDDWKSALGMISVKAGDSWTKYVLPGVFFSDVQLPSRDRIVAAGSASPNKTLYTEERSAMVSYSADGGRSWSFIYRNPNARRINALAPTNSNDFWAVGDGGLILRLEPVSQALAKRGGARLNHLSSMAVRLRKKH